MIDSVMEPEIWDLKLDAVVAAPENHKYDF